ncbi:MAG: hypothetical protein JEZ02_15380 [Desulfatibacillum sp.]|nr:hypothetical protein [Desulfatibacillum sp.]
MKLRSKIYLLSIAIPLLISCVAVVTGGLAINGILHRLNRNLLSREIVFVSANIENEYQILVDAAVETFPHYVSMAQNTIMDKMKEGEFPVSGTVFVFKLDGAAKSRKCLRFRNATY